MMGVSLKRCSIFGVQSCVDTRYKRALEEAKELQSNISKAKQSAAARRKRRAKDLLEKARDDGGGGGSGDAQATKAALARVSTLTPEVIESRLKVGGDTHFQSFHLSSSVVAALARRCFRPRSSWIMEL